MNRAPSITATRTPINITPWELRSGKIRPWHQERLAAVYIRQSTPQQVLDHQESTRLQYGLKNRALELGWSEERVLIIDDDLGKSGASVEGREGFHRLVSEVSLDHVGIILGMEMSRLARSCKDWHQLLEICALFDTLIGDADGIYDPAQYNDRLLLGLKGTMSEAELHILKQRMDQGRLNKARRGELSFPVPTGYLRRPSGEVALDPDEQVQGVVRLILRKFEELGTVNGVLRYLVKNRVQLGIRVREGPGKGELEWHRPNRVTLQNLLKNPIYAGAYAYGRRQVDPRRKKPGRPSTGRVVIEPEGWTVLLQDRFPAYICWEQYERNMARLKANRAKAEEMGAVGRGPSLLAGLLVCAKCGNRMTVRYNGEGNRHTYLCNRLLTDYGTESCQTMAGPRLDQFVSRWVLEALGPVALELSLEAASNVEREREEISRLWHQRLERAAYEAERAGRQYRLVEPENRLVARQLEREWEEKLAAQKKLEEEYHRFERNQPRILTAEEREAIRQLASDIPALWEAPTTTNADRKEIIRQVVQRIVVDSDRECERVRVVIEWMGGMRTEGEMVRPVKTLRQLSYYQQLCDRACALAGEGLRAKEVAQRLNAEGYRPPKRRDRFGEHGVRELLRRLGLGQERSRSRRCDQLGEHNWWLPSLAREIPMPEVTLYNWIRRGWVKARQEEHPPKRWIIWADGPEVERIRRLHQRPAGYHTRRLWIDEPSRLYD